MTKPESYEIAKEFRLQNCVYCDCYEECYNHDNSHIYPQFCPNFFYETLQKNTDLLEWELY